MRPAQSSPVPASRPWWRNGVSSAERVRFILDAAPIRDEYELGYTWDGDRAVSWSLTEPGKMLTSMDGMYVLEPVDMAQTKVTYQHGRLR